MNNRSLRHWATLAACCGLSASSIGICVNSVGVFFTSASAELGVGRGAFAFHGTIANIVNGLFAPFAMLILRKRNFKALVGLGVLLAGAATMLMARAHSLREFYALGALRGIGCSFFSLVVITFVIGNWFEEKHGLAVGIALSFSGLSGAVFSPLLSGLIGAFGWRNAYIAMGAGLIAFALPGALLLLDPFPAMRGLVPYGKSEESAAKLRTAERERDQRPFAFFSQLFISVALLSVSVSTITGIAQHFPGHAETFGAAASTGAAMISAAMIGNIIFKLLIGVLSDRIGPLNAGAITVAVTLCALALLAVIDPLKAQAAALAAAFLFGAIYAIGAVGCSLITRRVFGVGNYAKAYPVVSLCGGIGSALSLSLIGLSYDLFKTYRVGIIAGIALSVVNSAVIQMLRLRASNPNGGLK